MNFFGFTGKNRLSNIFTKQSFKANSKKLSDLKGGRVEKRRKRPVSLFSQFVFIINASCFNAFT